MDTSAGIISPARFDVRALYSLQKPIRLMPCPARAGPIGGAGLAFPASIRTVTTAFNFFAITSPLWFSQRLCRCLLEFAQQTLVRRVYRLTVYKPFHAFTKPFLLAKNPTRPAFHGRRN